ncbi:hypothetical protein AOP6_0634 [Desulfuromonas sp. AOP6]|nr:hypothetical protein AOP6_0634 [Desulfuromonas sp. AOP6]
MTKAPPSMQNEETIKIQCPECGHSKRLPAKAVPAKGAVATCPKCAGRFQVPPPGAGKEVPAVASRVASAATQGSARPDPVDPPPVTAKVKFQTFVTYDNRFKGKGEVRIADGFIQIQARRRWMGLFSGRKTERYPLAAVRNLFCKGKTVQFVIPQGKRVWQAYLVCADQKTAQALAARLPKTVDGKFTTTQQANNELKERMSQLPAATPVTWALLALNIMAYLAMAWTTKQWLQFDAAYLTSVGGNYSPLTTDGQWWRMLTATFLHAGLLHLVFNMLALYHIGRLVERLHGPWAYLSIYLLAGIAGSCGTLLFSPLNVGIGASGAVFGVMGAMVIFFQIDRDFLTSGARNKIATTFAIYGFYALMNGIGKAGIDNAAHVGGALTGIALAWFIGKPLRLKKEDGGWLSRRALAGVGLVLLGVGVALAAAPKRGSDYRVAASIVELQQELSAKEKILADEVVKMSEMAEDVDSAKVTEVVTLWQNTYQGLPERLAQLQPENESLQKRQEVLLAYIRLKQEGGELMAEAFAKEDNTLAKQSVEKLKEANELASGLAKPIQWNER